MVTRMRRLSQVGKLEKASEEEAQRLEREREDMEATLHEVASDLGRLALLYRTQGKAPHAVPLYMTALAIYEKTLGPDHPEVAKDLVNLGNGAPTGFLAVCCCGFLRRGASCLTLAAFCDQNQHKEAVPLYLRALAIDQAALGDDHPEVAMDLSNLGIVYRVQVIPTLTPNVPLLLTTSDSCGLSASTALCVPTLGACAASWQGRRDEAIALFQRAYTIMSDALGPEDPKTLTVARNLSATQIIEVPISAVPAKAPPAALAQRLSTPRGGRKTSEEVAENLAAAAEKRDAVLCARVERAAELRTPRGGQTSSAPSAPAAPIDISEGAPADVAINGTDDAAALWLSTAPPSMPKLKLNLNPPSSAADGGAGGSATPRSTYTKASSDARAAVEDAKAGGGSARSMLHKHVAHFEFCSESQSPR